MDSFAPRRDGAGFFCLRVCTEIALRPGAAVIPFAGPALG